MNAFLGHLYVRFRWVHLPAMLLVALLQRSPLVRLAITVENALGGSMGQVLRSSLATVTALGAYNTLAGATSTLLTNPTTPATATVGQSFNLVFTISGSETSPRSFEVKGQIPPGLSVPGLVGDLLNNVPSGSVTGTPTQFGLYTMKIRAWNGLNKTGDGGDKTFDLVISVKNPTATLPTVSIQPSSQSVSVGGAAVFTATVTGTPTPALAWSFGGDPIEGATTATLTLDNVQLAADGVYKLSATNTAGNAENTATLTVSIPDAVTISTHPLPQTAAAGQAISLSVVAETTGPTATFQWFKDDEVVPGATDPTLVLSNLQETDGGDYSARVTAGTAVADSRFARVVVGEPVVGKIVNMSVRAVSGFEGQPLIVGFYVSEEKQVLIRGVGPRLTVLGVPDVLDDPVLEVFGGSTSLQLNDDWATEGQSALAAVFAQVFAFSLIGDPPDDQPGKDSALIHDAAGGRTVHVRSAIGGQMGVVLAEVYDIGSSNDSARLINVSARNEVGTGDQILIAGLYISGNAPKQVLVRGVGPALFDLKVPDFLVDPQLAIYTTDTPAKLIASNDDWEDEGNSPQMDTAIPGIGFVLAPGSKDAALLITLPAGGFTVQLSGGNLTTGNGLVEIYEVPPH